MTSNDNGRWPCRSLWKYCTGAPGRDVTERFGRWNVIYIRFTRWAKDGTWEKLLASVQEQADVGGEIGWVVSIDSTIARVPQHGAILKRNAGASAESQEVVVRAAWSRHRPFPWRADDVAALGPRPPRQAAGDDTRGWDCQ
ncbi:transposase [Microbacterium suaedae]|uniref:transposase n=1 Tax=Microbacterium suaedae TaxID=2067813 RepID=UPI0038CBF763